MPVQSGGLFCGVNMAVKISGVLKDGAGKPVVNCAIELRARRTSPTVVAHVVATCVTDNNGAYVIEAEPGYYEVALHRNGWQPTRVGDIYVAPTDAPGTLNAFLDAPKDSDLRPEVMKRFEEMVDAVARQSEQVTNDRERAEAVAEAATNAAKSALDSKNKAQQNAEAAAKSEQNAKQHRDEAQRIVDDLKGRNASTTSGMHGFGQAFTSADALTFNGQADFVEWLKKAVPGRYAVSIADSSVLLVGTKKFNGTIDVMWSPFDNDESDTAHKFKTLLFFNQYYEGEHSIHRLTYSFSGNNWNATVNPIIYDGDSLAFLLSRTAGSGSYYKYPAVGVPIMAAYQGESFGADVSLGLGDIVPGSCLGPLAMNASVRYSGIYGSTPKVSIGSASTYNFPGRYMALSGSRSDHGRTLGYIGLFVRID